ncbi:forkhead associated domain and Pkinase domain-containing protein [Phanerochaete sordida]|uniref:Forkhead associated domain and Pkinase domain-containing protein n=1 Tax=Phanerochaete sordida TaxID=48140 RepID=A0A9P3G9V6_9APHY|nr:forkhead associated domain and Pkinase domain-containing protein [Phanerochaete sordida]
MALDQWPATQVDSQQATQLSESSQRASETHLWGYLVPCSPQQRRIDFSREKTTYKIGRNRDKSIGNDHILSGMKISNQHCEFRWDGRDDKHSTITVFDNSSNGTFVNGEKIGKGRYAVLKEGNEIAFGTHQPNPGTAEDYRFIYRHLAGGPPVEGLYAHYDITEELGKGSFATVMKAMCKENGHWYAVKMIQTKNLKRSMTKQQANGDHITVDASLALHKEVQILQKLQHPNICQLKEVFYDPDYVHIVLEWIAGGDLLEYIIKRGGLSEDETRHITYQLCEALAYIHSQGIAHRDLKPENVLLTTDNPPIVKVADFGLAKAIDSLTMLRTMCGTPSYLAPEVVQQNGKEGYQKVVDSWSVGVIVFSMLTNSSPFIEPSYTTDVKTKILERTVDWTLLNTYHISPLARDFIRRLLEADPEQRLSLSDALRHDWLAPYAAEMRTKREVTATPPLTPARELPRDISMADAEHDAAEPPLSQTSSHYAVPGAFPSGSQDPARTLQRRRKILEQARGAGLDPSVPREMLSQVDEDSDDATTPTVARAGQPQRPLKRKAGDEFDSSLSPMPEDEGEDEDDEPGPSTRKGRMTSNSAPGTPGRRGPKAGRGRGGKAVVNGAEESDDTRVRRSNRLGQVRA